MWFRSVYLKTLRDARIPILGWGIGTGLLMWLVISQVPSLIATPQERAALVSLSASFAWFADPVGLTTPGGYATWKYGLTILLVTLWPLLTCARMLRGEESRGSLDVLLSLPRSRVRVALEKVGGVWTALLGMGLLIGLLVEGGGRSVSADFGVSDALLFGLNVALIGAVFGGVALLLSQFTEDSGTASGWTAAILLVSIVLDMSHRVFQGTDWISRFSPIYYYNLSKPLVPGYGANAAAMLLLLALAILLSGAGIWLFARRDIGGVQELPGPLRRRSEPTRPVPMGLTAEWSLRSVYGRSLRTISAATLWWTVGIAGFAGWMVVVVKQTAGLLRTLSSAPAIKGLIKVGGGDATTNANLLSALLFFLPLLLMAFAVTQASRWAADEEDGRFELLLATPQSRLGVLASRFGALATATVLISVITLASVEAASALSGLTLDGGNLVAATLGMIPLGLLMAAIGYLFAGWLRAAVDTGLLSLLLAAWFFITFIGPGLSWPDPILRLSAFYYYGTPLLKGLRVGDMLVLLAVGTAALALASVRFTRKDIGR
ncbi:MAG TPA: ABC transporter permease subunit [Candidatus Solibacter sp.]|nr:ABC transporter permease subunit [Candidatus Solibacter sp.]